MHLFSWSFTTCSRYDIWTKTYTDLSSFEFWSEVPHIHQSAANPIVIAGYRDHLSEYFYLLQKFHSEFWTVANVYPDTSEFTLHSLDCLNKNKRRSCHQLCNQNVSSHALFSNATYSMNACTGSNRKWQLCSLNFSQSHFAVSLVIIEECIVTID